MSEAAPSDFTNPAGPLNPLAAGEPGKVEDMLAFGLIPGLIINKLRQRKAERDHDPNPLARLSKMSFKELGELERSLEHLLDAMDAPAGADPDYAAGYACHMRLMRWMTEEGQQGQAIRHALDDRDGNALIAYLGPEYQQRAGEPEFFLGFQAANGELAARFEAHIPKD